MPPVHILIVVFSNIGLLGRNNLFILVHIFINQNVDFHEVTDIVRHQNQFTKLDFAFNFFEELHELLRVVSDQIVAVVHHDDYVSVFVLLDKIVELALVLHFHLQHVHDWFLAFPQIYVQFLPEHAAVHCVVKGLPDEDALARFGFAYHKKLCLVVVQQVVANELKQLQLDSDRLLLSQVLKIAPVYVVVLVHCKVCLVELELCRGLENVQFLCLLLVF